MCFFPKEYISPGFLCGGFGIGRRNLFFSAHKDLTVFLLDYPTLKVSSAPARRKQGGFGRERRNILRKWRVSVISEPSYDRTSTDLIPPRIVVGPHLSSVFFPPKVTRTCAIFYYKEGPPTCPLKLK
jgi:hypothetical protein